MFERFTRMAREVVIGAQEQARERRAGSIRTEHLLAALYEVPGNLAVAVLTERGVTQADVESDISRLAGREPPLSDADALATLGIDLDEVRRQVEEAFGPGALERTRAAQDGRDRRPPGHIPFDRTAKKVLKLALREALRLKHDYVGPEHILLGMLHEDTGAAGGILRAHGIRQDDARTAVEQLVRTRKAS